ncbi:MAG: hypothetical protein GX986_08010 [Firmicutes bacterium]|nr:hypothetical protein [Bacillota bacterium]
MDFSRLIAKWGEEVAFTPPGEDGYYDDSGWWVPGDPLAGMVKTAAIFPLSAKELQFYEGGTYTTADVKVYISDDEPIPIGTAFTYRGYGYEIREQRDYIPHAGVCIHVAKKMQVVDA